MKHNNNKTSAVQSRADTSRDGRPDKIGANEFSLGQQQQQQLQRAARGVNSGFQLEPPTRGDLIYKVEPDLLRLQARSVEHLQQENRMKLVQKNLNRLQQHKSNSAAANANGKLPVGHILPSGPPPFRPPSLLLSLNSWGALEKLKRTKIFKRMYKSRAYYLFLDVIQQLVIMLDNIAKKKIDLTDSNVATIQAVVHKLAFKGGQKLKLKWPLVMLNPHFIKELLGTPTMLVMLFHAIEVAYMSLPTAFWLKPLVKLVKQPSPEKEDEVWWRRKRLYDIVNGPGSSELQPNLKAIHFKRPPAEPSAGIADLLHHFASSDSPTGHHHYSSSSPPPGRQSAAKHYDRPGLPTPLLAPDSVHQLMTLTSQQQPADQMGYMDQHGPGVATHPEPPNEPGPLVGQEQPMGPSAATYNDNGAIYAPTGQGDVSSVAEQMSQPDYGPKSQRQPDGYMSSAQEESFLANQLSHRRPTIGGTAAHGDNSMAAASQADLMTPSAKDWLYGSSVGQVPLPRPVARPTYSDNLEHVGVDRPAGLPISMPDIRYWQPGTTDGAVGPDQLMSQKDFQMLEPHERELVLRETRDSLAEAHLADELIKQQSEFVNSIIQRHDVSGGGGGGGGAGGALSVVKAEDSPDYAQRDQQVAPTRALSSSLRQPRGSGGADEPRTGYPDEQTRRLGRRAPNKMMAHYDRYQGL
jgi:hypothetical protein